MNNRTLNSTAVALSALAATMPILWLIRGDYAYQLGEWWIHYFSENHRRGLAGQALLFVSETLGLDAQLVVSIFALSLNFSVTSLFYALWLSTDRGIHWLLLIYSPAVAIAPVASVEVGLRKELIPVLLFLAFAILRQHNPANTKIYSALLSIGVPVSILNHEVSLFLVPFIIAFLIQSKSNGLLDKVWLLWHLLATTITVTSATIFSLSSPRVLGTGVQCRGLISSGWSPKSCEPMFWLSQDIGSTLEIVLGHILTNGYFLYFPVSIGLLGIPFLFLTTSTRSRVLVVIGVLGISPLFFLGTDWGRWLVIGASISTIFFVLEKAVTPPLEKASESLVRKNKIFQLLFSAPFLLLWGVPNHEPSGLGPGVLNLALNTLSRVIGLLAATT